MSETLPHLPLDTDLLDRATDAFAGVKPWRGFAPVDRERNFLGAVIPLEGSREPAFEEIALIETAIPSPNGGEGFLEYYSLINSVKDAQDQYRAVSLGAHDGRPLVNAALAIRRHNPLPYHLVGVEGDHHMCDQLRRNFIANGIDPADHTIINAIVSCDNKPLLFPTTEVRTGANVSLHTEGQTTSLLGIVRENELSETVLKSLLVDFTTGLLMPLTKDNSVQGELHMESSVTVTDIIAAFDRVDYLEVDIQSAEEAALPPAADVMTRNVRWAHIGTHGHTIHDAMTGLFSAMGWEIHADVLPQTRYMTPDGPFSTQDGVVIARNPYV